MNLIAGFVSNPGTETGPCTDVFCKHRICTNLRVMAGTNCGVCGGICGYKTMVGSEHGTGKMIHLSCVHLLGEESTVKFSPGLKKSFEEES